jgi:hypothetical protein
LGTSNATARFHSTNYRRGRGLAARDQVPAIAEAMLALSVTSATLDGEGWVVDDRGVTDFERLRSALAGCGGSHSIFLFGFDLLALDGEDLCRHLWEIRRATLTWLLRENRASRHFSYLAACTLASWLFGSGHENVALPTHAAEEKACVRLITGHGRSGRRREAFLVVVGQLLIIGTGLVQSPVVAGVGRCRRDRDRYQRESDNHEFHCRTKSITPGIGCDD